MCSYSSRTDTNRFTASNARDICGIRQQSFDNALLVIRNMIDLQIKEAARKGFSEVSVDVPRTIFGHDMYEFVPMCRAVARQLRTDGYSLNGSLPNFTISWHPKTSRPSTAPKALITVPKPKTSK